MVAVGVGYFVKQHDGLHSHYQHQHQSGEDVDIAFPASIRMGPQQVHRDVAATVAGSSNAPKIRMPNNMRPKS